MGETTQDLTPGRPAINGLADLRPGDLIFTRISEPLAASLLVKLGQLALGERVRIGRRSFDHVIVVTDRATTALGLSVTYIDGPQHDRPLVPYPVPARGVQAMPRGAELVELTDAKHWTEYTAVVRLPESYPGQGADVARIAREFVTAEVEYSFASYLALALWRAGRKTPRLERWIDRRLPARTLAGLSPALQLKIGSSVRLPAEAICSVLADECWTATGMPVVEGVARQAVSPGALALALWRRPGAVWGGPGILG